MNQLAEFGTTSWDHCHLESWTTSTVSFSLVGAAVASAMNSCSSFVHVLELLLSRIKSFYMLMLIFDHNYSDWVRLFLVCRGAGSPVLVAINFDWFLKVGQFLVELSPRSHRRYTFKVGFAVSSSQKLSRRSCYWQLHSGSFLPCLSSVWRFGHCSTDSHGVVQSHRLCYLFEE